MVRLSKLGLGDEIDRRHLRHDDSPSGLVFAYGTLEWDLAPVSCVSERSHPHGNWLAELWQGD